MCVRVGARKREREGERANEKARETMRRKGARVVVGNETEAWSRERERKEKNERAKRMRDRRLHLESIHGGGYTIFPINYGRFCRIIRREGTCGFVQCCLKIVRHSAV